MSHLFGFAHKFVAFRRVFFFPSIFSSIYANWAIDKLKATHASVCVCAPSNVARLSRKTLTFPRQWTEKEGSSAAGRMFSCCCQKTFIDRCRRRRISTIFLYIHQHKLNCEWIFFLFYLLSHSKHSHFFPTKTSARVEFEKFVRFFILFSFFESIFFSYYYLFFAIFDRRVPL